MKKWIRYTVIICAGILLNVLGRYITVKLNMPFLLNSTGTILTALYTGPVFGVIVGAVSCIITHFFNAPDIYLLLCEGFLALAFYFISDKFGAFKSFPSTLTYITVLGTLKGILYLQVAFLFLNNDFCMELPNGLVDYLEFIDFSHPAAMAVAALFIGFLDMFVTMLLLYAGINLGKTVYRKIKIKRYLKRNRLKSTIISGFIAVAFLLAFKAEAEAAAPDFVEKIYNSDNGLVGGCANDIAQTDDGTLWIATYGGLYSFNGSKFEAASGVEAARSVSCLMVDDKGNLWTGSNGSGVTVNTEDGRTYIFSEKDGLPSNTIKDMVQANDAEFYIASTGKLCLVSFTDGKLSVETVFDDIQNVTQLVQDSNGHVVALSASGEFYLLYSGSVWGKTELSRTMAEAVAFDRDGILYVGTDNSVLYRYDVSGNYIKPIGVTAFDTLSTINDIYFDTNGYIYLCAENGIGYIDNKGRFSVINAGSFDNSIDHIFKDYQGNLWFTSSRCGILSCTVSGFEDIFASCNLDEEVVNAVTKWHGKLYVGTDNGLRIIDTENLKEITDEYTENLYGTRIRCLMTDSENNLWICTYGKGVIELSSEGKTIYEPDKENIGGKVRVCMELSDGSVMVASDLGLVNIKDSVVTKSYRLSKDLPSGMILCMTELSDGTLLVGMDGDGIVSIKDGKVCNHISFEEGPCDGVILRMTEDKINGGVFVVTGIGICYMDKEGSLRELKSIPYFNNFDLIQCNNGKTFVLGGAGIYVLDSNEYLTSDEAGYVLLDSKSGLPGDLISNSWNYYSDDEILYICGNTGVYALDTNDYTVKVTSYRTKISGAEFDGNFVKTNNSKKVVIPRGTKIAKIIPEVNNYTTTDPYIRYYLAGVDEEKKTVLLSQFDGAVYANIPAGEYIFHLEVLDINLNILSTSTYTVIKEPEVFETARFSFYFCGTLILIVALVVISLVRIGAYVFTQKQRNEYEKILSKLEKEKSEALVEALHQEELANRSKSEFLATMSHEIRTPINAILGFDTVIMRETDQNSIRKYAEDVYSAGNTLLTLINDILDFSKIESGKLELVPDDYDLRDALSDLVNMISPKAESKKLSFEVIVNPDTPANLYGDVVRIKQIILNILNNAVKYTTVGKVLMKVDYEPADKDSIALKVTVSDTGIGIKEEDIKKIFAPYQRVDEQKNKNIEGTGLGLNITQKLLMKMGSRLEVESTYGEGSSFAFTILQPVKGEEKVGECLEKATPENLGLMEKESFHAPSASVLVVDDVEMNLLVVENLLKRNEMNIVTCESGFDAIKLCKDTAFDIILMDAMMPDLNGYESLVAIREQCPLNLTTPVIVLTAHAIKGAREEYLNQGFDDYLSKPVDPKTMEEMLKKYLPKEKLEPADKKASVPKKSREVKERIADLISALSQIPGIDIDEGIQASGGFDIYTEICKNFYDTANDRIKQIKTCFEKGNIADYTIQVHALKSSARLVGAGELSEKAFELETAGRNSDTDLIAEKTPEILKEYGDIEAALSKVFGDMEKDVKPLIDTDELNHRLTELSELLETFDFDTAKELFGTLSEYSMPEKFEDTYKLLKAKFGEFERDKSLELIKTYLEGKVK